MTTHQPDHVPSRRRRLRAWAGLVGVQTWWLRGLIVAPLFGLLLIAALAPRR